MPASDPFAGTPRTIQDYGDSAFAITASDTVDLPKMVRAIWVATAGDITIIAADDAAGATPILFTSVPSGWWECKCRVRRVMSTGTAVGTRTGLVGVP